MTPSRRFFVFLLLSFFLGSLGAQTSSGTITTSADFDMSEFPLWTQDLRRAEIVAFGSFPFTVFFSTFIMDTYRYADHGADRRYAPWPFKTSGAIDMSRRERALTLSAAAAASVTIAIVDHLIVRHKRNKARRAAESLPPGDPIIIRSPWPPEDAPETPEEEGE